MDKEKSNSIWGIFIAIAMTVLVVVFIIIALDKLMSSTIEEEYSLICENNQMEFISYERTLFKENSEIVECLDNKTMELKRILINKKND